MGMLNDMENKGEEMMKNPDTRAEIEKIAQEKGISMDAAKEHFMKKQQDTQ